MPKPTHTFTLVLSGGPGLTDELTDALFEAGCDDALPGSRGGVVFLDFTREADSLREAVLSAIADAEAGGLGARVVRVEPDEWVTMAEIGRRIGRSRESVRQLVAGLRGPGGFPPPAANRAGKSPVWRWTEAEAWLREKGGVTPGGPRGETAFLAAVNGALEVRRHVPSAAEARRLYEALLRPRRGPRRQRAS